MTEHTRLHIRKANALVESSYKLTLNEVRVINYLIAKFYAKEHTINDTFILDKGEFADLFDLDTKAASIAMQRAAKSLLSRTLTCPAYLIYPEEANKDRIIEFHWLSEIIYNPDGSFLSVKWSPTMAPLLVVMRGFIQYRLHTLRYLKNINTIRIYELLFQYKKLKYRSIEVESLRKSLKLGEKYRTFSHFNDKVIKPAIEDINMQTDIQVSVKYIRTGRKITKLAFDIADCSDQMIDLDKEEGFIIRQNEKSAKEAKRKLQNKKEYIDAGGIDIDPLGELER